MATLGNTPRPGYVYDTETDTWVPIGVGAHTHSYIPNTLVDAKGDILTATADDTPARLAKGADGTVLVSDSTTSTGLAWQPYANQHVAGKNILINGGFDIWQRYAANYSGSPTANTPFYNGADRWYYAVGTGSNSVKYDRVSADTSGFQYGIQFGRNSGASGTAPTSIGQVIESVNTRPLSGKTVTFSFYAKKLSNFSGESFQAQIITGTGVDQGSQQLYIAWTGGAYAGTVIPTLTTTMTRYSVTAQIPAGTNEAVVAFVFYPPSGTAGANEFVQVEGVQLEVGSTPTPFSRAGGSIGGELALCQRYYYRIGTEGASSSFFFSPLGMANATTQVITTFQLPQVMRVKPSSIDYSAPRVWDGVNSTITASSVVLGDASTTAASVNANGTGFTVYRPYWLMNNSGSYIGFNAEL